MFDWKSRSSSKAPATVEHSSAVAGSLIELRGVRKTYKSGTVEFSALKGIDLCVARGEFVAIVGKSGSGKSTLINMITGIDRPSEGAVIINQSPLHEMNEDQLARWRSRNLGIVFQFFQLLPTLSLLENVMLPMDFAANFQRTNARAQALQLLDLVDMSTHAHKLPAAVSGGQQQRVAIARALANDPPLLIADEPTGNLDSRTAESVFALFERLVERGKTIIMVTHDADLAKRATRIITIADGEIVPPTSAPEAVVDPFVEAPSEYSILLPT